MNATRMRKAGASLPARHYFREKIVKDAVREGVYPSPKRGYEGVSQIVYSIHREREKDGIVIRKKNTPPMDTNHSSL